MNIVIKFILLIFFFSLINCSGNKKNESDCVINELNLSEDIGSIVSSNTDTIEFDLRNIYEIDSLFIYEPYTPIKKIEMQLGCEFASFNYQDDDTWCLLVIKTQEKKI